MPTPAPPAPRAYSYTRFSTPEQARGDSYRRQTAAAEEFAFAHNLDLDSTLTFHDLGVSAYRQRNVTVGALRAFLEAVENGRVPSGSWLLVESLDRISRAEIVDAQTVFMGLICAGITLATLADGKVFSRATINGNPFDLVASILVFVRANEESAIKGRRRASAWAQARARARAGERPITACGPGWLALQGGQWQVVADRAATVRRIFALALDGLGHGAIAALFNRERVPLFTRRAREWHTSTIAKILRNPAVVGDFVPSTTHHRDGHRVRVPEDSVITGYFPPVVDRDTWERARALRTSRSPLRGRHAAAGPAAVQYALAGGLARCAACGAAMTRVNKGPRSRPKLVCTRAKVGGGCAYRAIDLPWLEGQIWVSLPMVLASRTMDTVLDQGTPAVAKLSREITALEGELQSVIDLHRIVGVSSALAERIRSTEASLGALKAQRRRSASQRPRKPSATTRLLAVLRDPAGTPAALNLCLREVVDHVVVDPDDPDSPGGALRIAWRDGGESWMGLVREPRGRHS